MNEVYNVQKIVEENSSSGKSNTISKTTTSVTALADGSDISFYMSKTFPDFMRIYDPLFIKNHLSSFYLTFNKIFASIEKLRRYSLQNKSCFEKGYPDNSDKSTTFPD